MAKNKTAQPGAIEITIFRLTCSVQAFIEANIQIDDWLRKQPGFRSRHMYEQKNGYLADVLFWDSVAAGTASMHRLMEEHSDSLVHTMIDQRTVSWNIEPLVHNMIK